MSSYVKSTDFQAKDSLLTGDPNKIIKGAEINDEFNAIQTAVATKGDISSPTFLGNPTAPTQDVSNSSTRLATTAFVKAALALLHPVGSIYIAVVSTNPATLFGFGTWVAFGAGKALVGLDSGNSLMDTVEETFGQANAITVAHTHTASISGTVEATGLDDDGRAFAVGFTSPTGSFSASGSRSINAPDGYGALKTVSNTTLSLSATPTTSSTGSSGTNANYQPSIAVYMWKRTA
jgi:hypothetical protein